MAWYWLVLAGLSGIVVGAVIGFIIVLIYIGNPFRDM